MDKRESIYHAAIEIICTQGFHETTVKEIVEKANVSIGSFYNYFESKGELLIYIYMNFIENSKKISERISNLNLNVIEKLEIITRFFFDYLENNPYECKVVADNLWYIRLKKNELSSQYIFDSIKNFDLIIKNTIQEGIERGEIKNINVESIFQIFYSIILTSFAYNTPKEQSKYNVNFIIDSLKI